MQEWLDRDLKAVAKDDMNRLQDFMEVCFQSMILARLTTARSFSKTGASTAINKGVDPDLVMKLGRWKSPEVFFKHYVDWEQSSLTDAILE